MSSALMVENGKIELYEIPVLRVGESRPRNVTSGLKIFRPNEKDPLIFDLSSFRPDPSDFLVPGKKFHSLLFFDSHGELRKVEGKSGVKFSRIR